MGRHLGCVVRARPELKVVTAITITARELEVGTPWTNNSVIGESRCTLMVPGMRSRKVLTLLLSVVALTVAIVVSVTVFPLMVTVWTYAPTQAWLMSSLSCTIVVLRDPPSILTRR